MVGSTLARQSSPEVLFCTRGIALFPVWEFARDGPFPHSGESCTSSLGIIAICPAMSMSLKQSKPCWTVSHQRAPSSLHGRFAMGLRRPVLGKSYKLTQLRGLVSLIPGLEKYVLLA